MICTSYPKKKKINDDLKANYWLSCDLSVYFSSLNIDAIHITVFPSYLEASEFLPSYPLQHWQKHKYNVFPITSSCIGVTFLPSIYIIHFALFFPSYRITGFFKYY